TEQYDEFLARGWITESNLDRFDATCAVWRHPVLDAGRLRELLFHCYREFYRLGDVARKVARVLRRGWDHRTPGERLARGGGAGRSGGGAWRRAHPRAGGRARVRVARASDSLPRRRRTFGLERAPLPRSLALSRSDEEINRRARLVV